MPTRSAPAASSPKALPAAAAAGAAVTPKSQPQKALEKLGLRRDIDLALHLPLRYEDETRITRLADARDGDMVQIEAQVTHSEITFRPRRQLRVTVDDGSDTCVLRFINFYPAHQKTLSVGARVRVRGEIRGGFVGREMVHPSFRAAGGELATALTPVYPTVAGLPQAYLRKAVLGGLARADLAETLPAEFLSKNLPQPLSSLREALQFLHHPTPDVMLATLEDRSHPAWQRLKAEELLAQQLSQLQARRVRAAMRAPPLRSPVHGPQCTLQEQLLERLPFRLTAAQQRVGTEIAADLTRHVPMHRLLQGDVGSGKTVVAALAAARCMDAGWQCALMAPTEILAEQHFRKLIGWLEPLGIQTAWLTGSQKAKERREALAVIESGAAGLVVGTHAVIQDKVVFKNLALAIIDEQHRFGVAQRLALRSKMTPHAVRAELVEASGSPSTGSGRTGEGARGEEPHLLMMTATPIPRTLAMSYYADLDVSTIDELPPGRTPIVTKVVSEARRDEVVERIRSQLVEGRQVYWVCPLIEESESVDLINATQTHEALSAALPGTQVGLLHSRMPVAEKKAVMALFTSGQLGVLVSTTVIEVGVDVPNASLMVIEHAERFGLSQLHQLRGRVGRGAAASACVLLYSTGDAPRLGETARARLKAMVETQDGFEIARRDLEIRGPGEFLGARQSGAPLLRFADLATDTELLAWARALAPVMLDRYPELAHRHILRWLGGKAEFLKA
ncbi:MAG: ATP-dependent DNA helicase RecG [Polaromonas sp.]|uniref:ATP-dependent DNA helicase RecG n=1 Tax=Polaromonas sp. TaxID=1869339 RepID=UPI0027312CB2|nr:ATP-dependent DNA helicase RecG [Polaromonas sp.]MDP2452232.1 ATP-dependent DNA helicase RecG [Polaromonas sp.]MDP3247786.1 ATP-dependent DNA helicase RecG [Polaromonas sp.]MDP3756171.1 ATP-dependent DNA helicase RecG [Polaromonas sp.]